MSKQPRGRGRRLRCRSGYTLAEVAISSLIVGTLMVASLQAVGQSLLIQNQNSLRHTACYLAEGLLNEILAQAYMEPGETSSPIGREAGESASSRENYNDVDDYHGYTESPPKFKNDTVISGLEGWERWVEVVWVDPFDLSRIMSAETGVKRITVNVEYQGELIYTAVGIRTNAP